MAKKNKQKHHASPAPAEPIRDAALPYGVWGADDIEPGARAQMDNAMRLPVSVAGALLPDAHIGYGLPIGGVLAVEDAVIPYAVGVDIACRMRMTVFPDAPALLEQKDGQFRKALLEGTKFGAGAKWGRGQQVDHAVLDDPDWDATRLLKSLKDTAYDQLGTSGTGNHFVEWGRLTVHERADDLDLAPGEYLALLSHSGSRAVGFKIANTYSQMAIDAHPGLDPAVRYLGWLPMASEAGAEYWLSMQLAGRYAAANHEVIHQRVARLAGLKPLASVENHHNFAWKEQIAAPDGFGAPTREAIVHRKGATPAGAGVYGIIPGSMAAPGYLVRGLGSAGALQSASHGAGRTMSRREALNSITKTARDQMLRERGVTLLGGGLDESPQAYKDIARVIAAQRDLVDIVAAFEPRIVRMADEPGDV